ncbi:hypothetical protein M422DRAFT_255070 [Sphaerobolus stellatus SS14]|uniref:Uncharacterized protein n=1 Tax=Sphaerobolus stellatus (strain SS14) TaxID=990650 RepID=A0A0C9VU76_SPHS4|nr:hypothetical protein M422DRAFT_255070 [Sphaerobolus stellatus SS14]
MAVQIHWEALQGQSSAVINMAQTTLDALGEEFRPIENGNISGLAKAYKNLMTDAFFERSDAPNLCTSIAFQPLLGRCPSWLIHLHVELPSERPNRLREYLG